MKKYEEYEKRGKKINLKASNIPTNDNEENMKNQVENEEKKQTNRCKHEQTKRNE